MKLITFIIPCYNSEKYMKKAIYSLLKSKEKIEIIIVNDGSEDHTLKIAQDLKKQYPKIIKVINQTNKGPGGAINSGLKIAKGKYFKIVDSDDWLEEKNLNVVLEFLKKENIDVLLTNYVLEKNKHKEEIKYNIPINKKVNWQQIKNIPKNQFILMHSIIVKTKLLKKGKLKLPETIFYVDNLFVFYVLQHLNQLIYLDIPLYHYIIGRNNQTVNKKVMINRIDDLISIVEIMQKDLKKITDINLKNYLKQHIEFIMNIAIEQLKGINTPTANQKIAKLKMF